MRDFVEEKSGPPVRVEEDTATLCSWVTISSGMATGILGGGVLMAIGVIRTDLRPAAILGAATVLYGFGAVSGLLLGSLLGVLGRPATVDRPDAEARVRSALLTGLPLLAAGWVISAAMASTGPVLRSGPWPLLFLVAVAWGMGGVVGIWAAVMATQALRNVMSR